MLRYDRERKIVAIAAFVVGLEGIVGDGDDRAIPEISEGASDRGCGGITDGGKDCARRQGCVAAIGKGEESSRVNRHSVGDHLIGPGTVTVQLKAVACFGVESQCALNGKAPGAVSPPGEQKCFRTTASRSYRDCPGDCPRAAESAALDQLRTAARPRT